jgi:osmoprotectant transport system ATP-binding protein
MIDTIGLTKRYGSAVAVDDLSLHVSEGELLVLLGGSGSGKTTTLKMVNRLIEPSAGRVTIGGQDVGAIAAHELRRRIGYVFQRIGLFPQMTVAENVGVTLTLLGWDATRIRRRVDELLELVELSPDLVRDRRPAELSGGQQQRVGVARALAASPRVMLLDEPFGALDPLTRDRLQQSFLKIRRQLDLTAIFVTHDMVEALLVGDRIAVMNGGRLIQVGTPRTLLQAPSDDYVRQLMDTPMRQARLVDTLLEGRPA